MMLHVLKIKETYFKDILSGNKTFELRKNDRNFTVGDLIHFVLTNGSKSKLTKNNLFKINYVLKNVPEYGLNKDYCIFSIEKTELERGNRKCTR